MSTQWMKQQTTTSPYFAESATPKMDRLTQWIVKVLVVSDSRAA